MSAYFRLVVFSGLLPATLGLTISSWAALENAAPQANRSNLSSSNSSAITILGGDLSSTAALDALYTEVENLREAKDAMKPHMSVRDRLLFYKLLRGAVNYQEFGCGGSTVTALAHPNIKKIQSIESSGDWVAKLRRRSDVGKAVRTDRLDLVHADIGPVKAWGYPSNEFFRSRWPAYSQYASKDGLKYDLIFVDGRFRVACFLRALTRITRGRRDHVALAIHDYQNRPQYHVVERFAQVMSHGDTLTVFRRKWNMDRGLLWRTIHSYSYNPA